MLVKHVQLAKEKKRRDDKEQNLTLIKKVRERCHTTQKVEKILKGEEGMSL
jgi:hypothetical protein